MSALKYDFDGVKSSISSGSAISNSMETIQEQLELLRKELNSLENNFHGKGRRSTLFANYEELYNEIGTTYNGFWKTLRDAKSSLEYLYSSAENDKRLYEEEQERLRREQEERERKEKEEKERREKEEEEKRKEQEK